MTGDRILDALPELSRKQFLTIRGSVVGDEPLTLLTGAARSGKTIASLIWWLLYVAEAPLEGELPMIARTRHSLARNVFGAAGYGNADLFGPLTKEISYVPGAPTARILDRTIPVFGAADSRSAPVILGMTAKGGYVDELTVMDQIAFQQFMTRQFGANPRVIATTNPDSRNHWVKKTIIDRRHEIGARVRQFTPHDNPHPDTQAWVERMVRQFPPGTMWHSRYILGQWVDAEGAIYPMFDDRRHVIPAHLLPTMTEYVALGVDDGTRDNTRALLIGIGPHPTGDGMALYVCGEWATSSTIYAEKSAELARWLRSGPGKPRFIYVDPAAKALREQFRKDRLGYIKKGVNTPVNSGIQVIASLFGTDRLFIADTCTHLLDEIPGYVWDEKAAKR